MLPIPGINVIVYNLLLCAGLAWSIFMLAFVTIGAIILIIRKVLGYENQVGSFVNAHCTSSRYVDQAYSCSSDPGLYRNSKASAGRATGVSTETDYLVTATISDTGTKES